MILQSTEFERTNIVNMFEERYKQVFDVIDEKLLKKVSKQDFMHHKEFMMQQNRETYNRAIVAQDEVKQLRADVDNLDHRFCTKVQYEELAKLVGSLKEQVDQLDDPYGGESDDDNSYQENQSISDVKFEELNEETEESKLEKKSRNSLTKNVTSQKKLMPSETVKSLGSHKHQASKQNLQQLEKGAGLSPVK